MALGKRNMRRWCLPFAVSLLFLSATVSQPSETSIERKGFVPIGEIVFVAGRAYVKLFPEEHLRTAVPRQQLIPNDLIQTAAGGRLSILFKDDTQLKLASNTTLVIKEVTSQKDKAGALRILLRLDSGEVWTRSRNVPEGLMIETPHATAAIRGTEWGISVKENESRVIVMEGNVQLSSPSGSITVGKNEQAVVTGREAPVQSHVIRPKDRTQWTYYLSPKRLLSYLRFRESPLGKAEGLFNEGQLEESAKAFEATLAGDPGNFSALTGLGLVALKRNTPEAAEGYLDRSLKAERGPLAMLGKSYLLISENRTEEAASALRVAEEFFPKSPLPFIFSAYLCAFQGDFAAALGECDRGLLSMPEDPLLLAFKADLLFILDRPEEAKRVIDHLLEANPESSEGHERLGFYYRIVKGDSKKAKEGYQRSVRLDPLNDEAIAKLADLLREEGYIPEAQALTQRALSIAPWNAMHHYNHGRLLADINEIDQARGAFRRSLGADTTLSRAYLGEGIVLLKEGRTEEAIRELSKATLFEPNLSEIYSFLGIAYYQKMDVRSALGEFKKAEECDPLDSTPHQLASAVYNDLYLPVKAIDEARKVLDLLPYRRASGEALLQGAQNGTMTVNAGLNLLDLPEWSLYYALKALFVDPYRNTSHIGVADAYLKLGEVSSLQGFNEFANPYLSEQLQGLTLDVNSLNFSNRYNTLISKPGHYLTLAGSYGSGDSEVVQGDVLATGDFGSRFPLTYRFYTAALSDSGYLPNNRYREGNAELILGYKPNYDHDFYVHLSYIKDQGGITPALSYSLTEPDDNQRSWGDLYWVQLGYHKRFSPTSHLLTDLRYLKSVASSQNPDSPVDLSGFDSNKTDIRNMAFGLRHMLTLAEDHQASYGLDVNLLDVDFGDLWPYAYPAGVQQQDRVLKRRSATVYLYDRWAIVPQVTLDAGLFLSRFSAELDYDLQDTSYGNCSLRLVDKDALLLNPRLGVAVELGGKGVFRLAYQKRATPGFAGELAPVGASGLITPTFDIFFNQAEDIQGSLEYELTRNIFFKALMGYETLSDLESRTRAHLFYGRAALNVILGHYFSFSARYHYNSSQYRDDYGLQLPGVPQHSGDARLVFVHPSQVLLSLRGTYVGERFLDPENKTKLKSYFTTDFYARKELFDKRIQLSFAVNNLFDRRYATAEGLPAKGRTFFVRLELRI